VRGEEGRGEGLDTRVEIVADVELDPLRAADDREARPQPGQAVGDGQDENQERVAPDRGAGVGLKRLDRALQRPRDAQAQQRRREQARGPEKVARAVAGEITPDRAGCPGQRRPSR